MATLEMNVRQVNSDFQAIKDKIVEHGVEVADGTKTAEYASKVGDVFEAGKKAQHDEFWDGILSGDNWQQKFVGSSWNDKTFYPHKDIKPTGSANNMFWLCEITDLVGRLRECGVTLDTSGVTGRTDAMFSWATKLTTAPYVDVRNYNYASGALRTMYEYCYKLKTIEGIRIADDGSTVLGEMIFYQCRELEDLTFYGVIGSNGVDLAMSPLLSRGSIENIINRLSTTTSGLTVTLSKTAVNNAFETSEGAADGSTSTEWTALIGTKTNWTISLV